MRKKRVSRIYRRFKQEDDKFDTKILNLADVSSFSPSMINLLQTVESGSSLSNKFWLCCSCIKLTTCHA